MTEGPRSNNNTPNDSESGSGENYGDEEIGAFDAEFDTFPIVLAIFIIAVNLTVIILFVRHRTLRSVTNSFLVSLAASDLLAGLCGIPATLYCSATHSFTTCAISNLTWRFISVSTVVHILLVSVDSYIAITHAMRYHNIVTQRAFFALVSLAWFMAAFVSLIQLSWQVGRSEEAAETAEKFQKTYDLATFVLFFVIPLLVMAYIYIRIFSTVRYHEKRIWRFHSPSDQHFSTKGKEESHNYGQRKTVTIFLAMLVIFTVCWLPYFILSFQELNAQQTFDPPAWVLYVFYYYSRFFTSFSNPLMYIFRKRDFKELLPRLICKDGKARCESRANKTLTTVYSNEQCTTNCWILWELKSDRSDGVWFYITDDLSIKQRSTPDPCNTTVREERE